MDDIQDLVGQLKDEVAQLNLDAGFLPLQLAKIVGMVNYINAQMIRYTPQSQSGGTTTTTAGSSATAGPTIWCPHCKANRTLTLV
jgi:hypothetical protein